MIDIQLLRKNPDFYKQKTTEKNMVVDVDKLLTIDAERLDMLQKIESVRNLRNQHAHQGLHPEGSNDGHEVGRELKKQLAVLETAFNELNISYIDLLSRVPNPAFDDVPVGDESKSEELKVYGEKNEGVKDHLDYATERGWVDFERGAKVAGAKFYFLKGDLALLENAVVQYALDLVTGKGFTYMTVPHMVNARIATGTGFAPRSSEQSDEYFIEGEDLSLIATAEISITGYHADEIIPEADLPLRYVGYSPCYRKEAGTYGKHTRGLFRVHQFNKLEMYAYTLPEDSAKMHEEILAVEEEVWQAMNIPYHIINIASGDLGAPAAKKYDIEYWSPVDQSYRELTSCSNCTDFQTRNLNIRVKRADGTIEMLHSLNGTVVSTARTLVAIMEHYQLPSGKLGVPDVLQKYMGGRKEI